MTIDVLYGLWGSTELLSYGPHVGMEAAQEFALRLDKIGLVYIDDYFIMSGDFPQWVTFEAKVKD